MSNPFENINAATIKSFLKSWRFWKPFLAILGGALAGYLYYFYVGCASGTCPITSNPYISTFWGGMLGFFLIGSFKSEAKAKSQEPESTN
jgi:hypothetical protein